MRYGRYVFHVLVRTSTMPSNAQVNFDHPSWMIPSWMIHQHAQRHCVVMTGCMLIPTLIPRIAHTQFEPAISQQNPA